jgi:DNA gyrase subunit A
VPRTLALRDMLAHYLDFQREVVTRRLEVRAAQGRGARARPPGYLIALDNLDAVIALIRGRGRPDAAREG